MAGPLDYLRDLGQVGFNSVSLGLTTRAADALGDGMADERLAAARERLGVAGDIANAAGWLVPGTAAAKGFKAARAGIGALPSFARAAAAKAGGLGTAAIRTVNPTFVGQAAARARLGLEASPGIVSRAAAVARANPWKTAAAVGSTVAGTGWSNQSRAERNVAEVGGDRGPVPQQSAAPDGLPSFNSAGTKQAGPSRSVEDFMGMGAPANDTQFNRMARDLIQSQGAGLSLNQLTTLAAATKDITPSGAASKPPAYKEVAGNKRYEFIDQQFGAEQARAQEMKARGDEEGAQMVWNEAAKVRDAQLAELLGADSVDAAIAESIKNANGGR